MKSLRIAEYVTFILACTCVYADGTMMNVTAIFLFILAMFFAEQAKEKELSRMWGVGIAMAFAHAINNVEASGNAERHEWEKETEMEQRKKSAKFAKYALEKCRSDIIEKS